MNLAGQPGLKKACGRQDVERLLEAIQFVCVALGFVGKGFSSGDEQIELFFR